MQTSYDILIIGGGAAGMAAALAAVRQGCQKILLIERNPQLGGILMQCIHQGFGLGYFKEDLTGQEYAARFIEAVQKSTVTVQCQMSALRLFANKTALLSGKEGAFVVSFDRLILATGCRERTLFSTEIAGSRPAGIFTSGLAQRLINVDGLNVGDDILIVGTGDVGQIMARQLKQDGKNVLAMVESADRIGGLKRNQEACIKAYDIPVLLNSTVIRIHGKTRVEGVTVRHRMTNKDTFLPCKTLLSAIGMIPETDLIRGSFPNGEVPPWLTKVGNCDYVHDIVDSVTADAYKLFS